MPDDDLLERLRRFHHHAFPLYRERFEDLVAQGQRPSTLFIGCSDSRLLPYLNVQSGDFVAASRAAHSGTGPYPPYVEHDGQVLVD